MLQVDAWTGDQRIGNHTKLVGLQADLDIWAASPAWSEEVHRSIQAAMPDLPSAGSRLLNKGAQAYDPWLAFGAVGDAALGRLLAEEDEPDDEVQPPAGAQPNANQMMLEAGEI